MPTPKKVDVENLTSSDFEVKERKPKILFFDIETSALTVRTWRTYQADAIKVINTWQMLSWSAKWQNGKHITKCLADYDGYDPATNNDKPLVTELWHLLSEADVVIGHNLDKFDVKKMNTRAVIHDMKPPEPYKTVDTLKLARAKFAFHSNKLDALGELLGVGRKAQTGGYDLWERCIAGDLKAWRMMKRYNRQDVVLLEAVYDRLLGWATTHPHIGILKDHGESCRNCGSKDLQRRGKTVTLTGHSARFHCQNCGAWMRGKFVKRTDIR